MSILIVPTSITMVFFAKWIIFAWTSNELIASRTTIITAVRIAGTGFNCVVLVPFSLQVPTAGPASLSRQIWSMRSSRSPCLLH